MATVRAVMRRSAPEADVLWDYVIEKRVLSNFTFEDDQKRILVTKARVRRGADLPGAEEVEFIFDGEVMEWTMAGPSPSKRAGRTGGAAGVKPMKIFISHSSRNLAAATALVDFLGKAFRLGSSDILCTSVEGHRLDGGTATPEALRQAIRSARVFIAIVSPESSASDYVLFEMGARWGSSLEIIPLLAPGEGAATLPSPLKDVHAPSISSHSDMHQLVDKLGRDHGWEAEPAASYQRSLDQLASLSPAAETRVSRAAIALHEGREHPVALGYAVKSAGGLERALSPDEILLLRGLISHPVPVVPEAGLTVSLDWHPYRTSAVVELLVDSSLVVKDEEADGIALTKQGKRACLEMGLFDQPR